MYRIRIELKANLCAADGDGYATVIDTDIVTDEFGIPFIPARRIKGCLREAANYIGAKHIDEIFGVKGNFYGGSLKISNADVEGHTELINELKKRGIFSPQNVTEIFTDTTASTSLNEDSSVKDNSLRFMRAVEKSAPWEERKNLVFISEVSVDEEYVEELSKICMALRHIGYKRTRGFGAVKCSLEKSETRSKVKISIPADFALDKTYILEYAVRAEENIMLPDTATDKTMDFINGQAVIGMLASKYLKKHSADSKFEKLFLDGSMKFSNLYISDQSLNEYMPVPSIFGKVKGENSDELVDLTTLSGTDEKIIKPVKNGYISQDMKLVQAITEIIYHNNMEEKDGGLYTQHCLSKGQLFRGTITGSGDKLMDIAELFNEGSISFGRSKTAQYSKCTLISARIQELTPTILHIKKGDEVIYILESNVVLVDEYASSTPSAEAIKKALEIKEVLSDASVLKYRTIKGFLSVMRLQRSHTRAIAAGSTIAIKSERDFDTESVIYIGEKQHEGFGKIRIIRKSHFAESFSAPLTVENSCNSTESSKIQVMLDKLEAKENMRMKAISFIKKRKNTFISKWNPSFIGRVTLMTDEADSRIDLEKRINSIKNKNKRDAAKDLLKHSESNQYKNWNDEKEYIKLILQLAKYIVKQEKGAEYE